MGPRRSVLHMDLVWDPGHSMLRGADPVWILHVSSVDAVWAPDVPCHTWTWYEIQHVTGS